MQIVLGLGNEGSKYRWTRHNMGFMVADVLAERTGAAFERRGVVGEVCWTAETAIAVLRGQRPASVVNPDVYARPTFRARQAIL